MSIVIAVKENNRVIFGADTQTSIGNRKKCSTLESNLKVTKMPNGILIGHAGLVENANTLTVHPEWFENLSDEGLTKRFLVMEVIPKLILELKEKNLLDKDSAPDVEMQGSYIVAQKDKLFYIHRTFAVSEAPNYVSIGCGSFAADAVFFDSTDKRSTKERILSALNSAAMFDTGVDRPFVLIDTDTFEYEITEEEA